MFKLYGYASLEKKQFIFSFANLLKKASEDKEVKIYTENYSKEEYDYISGISVYPLVSEEKESTSCIYEKTGPSDNGQEGTSYFMLINKAEVDLLKLKLNSLSHKLSYLIIGRYINAPRLGAKYIESILKTYGQEEVEILTIEIDIEDMFLAIQGDMEGYFPIKSLSKNYKQVLELLINHYEGIGIKDLKRAYKKERRK